MKPGQRVRPVASITRSAFAFTRSPMAAMRAPLVATSVTTGGVPEPSMSCAPLNKSVKSATEHLTQPLRQRYDQTFFQTKRMHDEHAFLESVLVDVHCRGARPQP